MHLDLKTKLLYVYKLIKINKTEKNATVYPCLEKNDSFFQHHSGYL